MFPLSSDEKSFLLRLARKSLEAAVCGEKVEAPQNIPAVLETPASAFVTLHERASLRGCVGFLDSRNPLYRTVIEAAKAAALNDARFSPVSPGELWGLVVEISVLSSFQSVRSVRPEEIQVGIHGLVVTRGSARGLLLPQVAVERNWTALRFLEETCRKAGLESEAWRRGALIQTFTAEVFSELSVGKQVTPG